MVFNGGWRTRRRGGWSGGYQQPYGGGYRRYGGYRPAGGSCVRDLFMVETGCCVAELFGCGPQLLLVAPRAIVHAGHPIADRAAQRSPRERLLAWLLGMIRIYQREISPHRPPSCRYSPTCSHYAAEALSTHGITRGLWLSARRLVRCRPGAVGGDDPVPLALSPSRGT
jgi:putative membrane protein insertion efficiency factor